MKLKISERGIAHMDAIAELFGGWKTTPDYIAIRKEWLKMTKTIEQLAVTMCGDGSVNQNIKVEIATKKLNEYTPKVFIYMTALFKDADKIQEKIMINTDPRGYGLKIKLNTEERKGIYTDWGGYGIFAPYGCKDAAPYETYYQD